MIIEHLATDDYGQYGQDVGTVMIIDYWYSGLSLYLLLSFDSHGISHMWSWISPDLKCAYTDNTLKC